jgi:hypothetical protein
MTRAPIIVTVVALVVASAAPLQAQEQGQAATPEPQPHADQPAEFNNPRFSFHHVDDGYLRLDLRSGEVAACLRGAVGWSCTLVPDERAAVDSEIARLQRDNAALKSALLERGLPLPGMPGSVPGAAPKATEPPAVPVPVPVPGIDSDRVMTMVGKVWQRLVEMMGDIQRDLQRDFQPDPGKKG